jgi:hypothetical protein
MLETSVPAAFPLGGQLPKGSSSPPRTREGIWSLGLAWMTSFLPEPRRYNLNHGAQKVLWCSIPLETTWSGLYPPLHSK